MSHQRRQDEIAVASVDRSQCLDKLLSLLSLRSPAAFALLGLPRIGHHGLALPLGTMHAMAEAPPDPCRSLPANASNLKGSRGRQTWQYLQIVSCFCSWHIIIGHVAEQIHLRLDRRRRKVAQTIQKVNGSHLTHKVHAKDTKLRKTLRRTCCIARATQECMSVCMSVCVSLSVCLSVCLSVGMYVCM